MRKFPVLLAGMTVLAFAAFAQNNTATVSGRVADPEGRPVGKAPVQAKCGHRHRKVGRR
jgi:hypothetical protein